MNLVKVFDTETNQLIYSRGFSSIYGEWETTQEAQDEIINEYVSARVADLLVKELHNSDIILQRDEHFVTLLPETDRETAVKVIKRIEKAAKEKLNLDLQIGYSTFPDEAVTFETLLDNAETRMDSPQPSNEKLLNLTPIEVQSAV